MQGNGWKSWVLGVVPGLVMVGCAGPTMTVPADVSKVSQQILITERSSFSGALADESFVMGDYKVTDVDRDWNSGSSFSVGGYGSSNTVGGYTYGFETADGKLSGTCATAVKEKGASIKGFSIGSQNASVGCECTGDGGGAKVTLESRNNDEYGGELQVRGGSYQVKAIYEREGGWSDGKPSGYRVDGDAPVGAVDVLKPGKVWLANSVESAERAELACIFAGLLLYQPPTDK